MAESIYNLIPPAEVRMEKPPMHKSKYDPKGPPSASTFHNKGTTHPSVGNLAGDAPVKPVKDTTHHTFGKKQGSYSNDATSYMKKCDNTSKVASLSEVKRSNPELLKPTTLSATRMPTVPKASDTPPVMNLVTSKNFVVANAVETILANPKRVSEGAKDFLAKEDYGKVPKYLTHIKNDIQAEFEYIQAFEDQQKQQDDHVKPLSEVERMQLIEGLKAKWEKINTDYQGATHLTKLDTQGKIRRKEKYEAELAQIEKDIEKLNRSNIHVNTAY